MNKLDCWISLVSGEKHHLLNPVVENITIADIAHALSMQCRFNGHVEEFYSIAQHSVLVSEYVNPEFALYGLLHDSAEAFVGDIVADLKHLPFMEEFSTIEDINLKAIFERFNLSFPMSPEIKQNVKEIDCRILLNERNIFIPKNKYRWGVEDYYTPLEMHSELKAWSQKEAKIRFLNRFEELYSEN